MQAPSPLQSFIDTFWEESIVPTLQTYIAIPNKSPMFDPQWEEHGYMEQALQLVLRWLRDHPLPGAKVSVGKLPGRTPTILVDVPGQVEKTVLLYGHLDKQPEMEGWREGLGPWTPVLEGEKLYGRGGADDGYAVFASICAIKALQNQGLAHARCVLLIEFCEESGSPDLPFYVDHFSQDIGDVDLVVCLDSGAGNYEQLWNTTSLRGMASGTLDVQVLREGVHSGDASGVVASSFRIARQLLERIEELESGRIRLAELHTEIPESRITQAHASAKALGEEVWQKFPFVDGMRPMAEGMVDLILNRTWRPTLSIVGQEGLPLIANAGNVLRPHTKLRLSFRLPPTLVASQAQAAIAAALRSDPPYGAKVTWTPEGAADGWNAPPLPDWLAKALDRASLASYGKPALHMGEGGTIPFMGMLGIKFPRAHFVVTGVLGPQSNAHGPNEFIHIGYAKKLTACVALIMADHAKQA
jgi:acetylornithine deacetylase/succinyl-diaminopimelate desuccinylase-like protein